jgi:hypothetical protein
MRTAPDDSAAARVAPKIGGADVWGNGLKKKVVRSSGRS